MRELVDSTNCRGEALSIWLSFPARLEEVLFSIPEEGAGLVVWRPGQLGRMKERVVIVDDEPGIRALLASYLSSLPLDCRPAKDAAEALALAAEEPRPSLVLSDIEMPGLSGFELLERLKELDETIQVVMVSGFQHIDIVRHCVRAGAYDYIVKPFEADDLLATVERALERARLIRQNEEYRRDLERMVAEQTVEIRQTRDIALLTLARLAESRDSATGRTWSAWPSTAGAWPRRRPRVPARGRSPTSSSSTFTNRARFMTSARWASRTPSCASPARSRPRRWR